MSAVLIEGGGEPIQIGDNVVLHYTGWTWDGEQFDSSWERQSPATFPITADGLIEGFVMALDQVTVGSRVIAVIPPGAWLRRQRTGQYPSRLNPDLRD